MREAGTGHFSVPAVGDLAPGPCVAAGGGQQGAQGQNANPPNESGKCKLVSQVMYKTVGEHVAMFS